MEARRCWRSSVLIRTTYNFMMNPHPDVIQRDSRMRAMLGQPVTVGH